MGTGDRRDQVERGSTDESLRSERQKTDAELAKSTHTLFDLATDIVSDARDRADVVLDDARAREDAKQEVGTAQQHRELVETRATEDAVRNAARRGEDALARDEGELRRLALVRLLAFERHDTDEKLGLERLRADNALASREDFMAIVSHDLRNLLGGIALSAELLKDAEGSADPWPKVRGFAERIQRCSARMNRLVGDLMDVASIDAGKLTLVRAPRSVELLLRDAVDAFEAAAAGRGIALTTHATPPMGELDIDHERILQVLGNLVGNALKFTPRGGQIRISAEDRGDRVWFEVTDTGEGMPPDVLDKIFERHFQSRDADRRGLGLGLFIAKTILEAHGGDIGVASTLGQGTTFHFTLPRH